MNTPITDFVNAYQEQNITRFHMPGHKGKPFVGCEALDITEVCGADALYEAAGIIRASEENASKLFGTKKTVYSTEGSSQCIRAIMYLVTRQRQDGKRPYVIASRNAHKAFLYAAALVDFDIVWLWPKEVHSLCSCEITPEQIEEALSTCKEKPAAVYLTTPDYLGGQVELKKIAMICHKHGTLLAVDNAHGAYLHFLKGMQHPMDAGADICCDSAHKTLPVLTGGAYLHIGKCAPEHLAIHAKQAMSLFGSTSPSYLTLVSLDLCNRYLAEGYKERLAKFCEKLEQTREQLVKQGWNVKNTDPLKLTIQCPASIAGTHLAARLRAQRMECEYADADYLVCMMTPETEEQQLEKLVTCLGANEDHTERNTCLTLPQSEQLCTVREAVFAAQERIPVTQAVGRICASPAVSCPPAIPIVVSGERITEEAISMFKHYEIGEVDVIC